MADHDFTASQKNAIRVPGRLLCSLCKAWKDSSQYSNKELNTFRTKELYRPNSMNGANAKLRCRTCVGQQITELQCEGPCGVWKELSGFSKNSRTRGQSWCIECTLWKEAQEPGVVTTAPGVGPDEEDNDYAGGSAFYDPELGDDSDDDDYDNRNTTGGGWGAVPSAVAVAEVEVPYIGLPNALHGLPLSVVTSKETSKPSTMTPSPGGQAKSAQSSVSNPWEGTRTMSTGGWSAVDARRRQPAQAIPFTGYGPNGQSSAQERQLSDCEQPRIGSGFAAQQQQPVARLSAPVATRKGRSGNWAKPSGKRTDTPNEY